LAASHFRLTLCSNQCRRRRPPDHPSLDPEWTDTYLLLSYPSLRTLFSNGFFRGICSGLGLLDIWIGFWEALHYHEYKSSPE